MSDTPILSIEGLNAYYGSAHVVQDVSFDVRDEPVCVIGRNGMGKTSLCRKFCNNTFDHPYEQTIGVDFFSHVFRVEHDLSLKLNFWDTAGSEHFKAITQTFYRNSAIVFLVYDGTQRSSFKDVLTWLGTVREVCHPGTVIVLVHNKVDLVAQAQVDIREARQLALAQRLLFFPTSSQTGQGVQECFAGAVRELMHRLETGDLQPYGPTGIRQVAARTPLHLDQVPDRTALASRFCLDRCMLQ